MKALLVASLIGIACAAKAGEVHIARTVDLDDQRQLDRLASEAPALYAKIEDILDHVGDQAPEQVARWMKTSFDAENAGYGYLLKTSDPPKARLSFVLGDTRYRAEVTLRNVRPKLFSGPLLVVPEGERPVIVPGARLHR